MPRPLPVLVGAVAVLAIGLCRPAAGQQEDAEHPANTARDTLLDDLLEQASREVRLGNYARGVKLYLQVEAELEKRRKQDPNARPTTEVGPGIDRGVGLYLRDQIAGLPADALREYRLTVDPKARQLLQQAVAARVPEQVEAVIARYPLSSVVTKALPILAALAMERGELGRAIRAYRALEARTKSTPRVARRAALSRAYAAVIRRDAREARHALAAYAALGGDPQRARTFAGSRTSLTHLVASIGGRTTQRSVAPSGFDPGGLRRRIGLAYPELPDELAKRLTAPPAFHEAVYAPEAELLFVTDRKTVRAVPLVRGARGSWVYSLLDKTSEPSRLEVSALRPALGPGRVFITLHRNRPARIQPGKDPDKPLVIRRKDWRVVALDRARGKLVWDAAQHPGFESIARNAEWVSPPLYHESAVYVVVLERKTDLRASLVRLDAASGKLRFRTFLVSRPAHDYLGLGSPPPAPSVSSLGHVLVATGLGAGASIETTRGDVVWIARYAAVPPNSQSAVVDEVRRFRSTSPLGGQGPVVLAPVDGIELVALDPASGKTRWRHPRGDARVCVLGPGGEVLLLGRRLIALDRTTGRVLYRSGDLGARAAAPPAVFPKELVAVTATGLVRIGLGDGRVLARYAFDDPLAEAGPAIALGKHGLATVGHARLNMYEDRAARVARIEARHAAGPERDGRLGLLHARRGELKQAIRRLRRALRKGLAPQAAMRVRRVGLKLMGAEARRRHARGRRSSFRLAAEHALAFLGKLATRADQPFDREERALLIQAAPLLRLYADTLAQGKDLSAWTRAAAAYQRLLWMPPGTLVAIRGGTEVDARGYGRLQLKALVAARGPKAYAEYERRAQAEYRLAKATLSKTGLQKVVDNYPASRLAKEARWDLATLYDSQGLRSKSVVELEQFLRDHPGDPRRPEALARLAVGHQLLRRLAKARRYLGQLLALEPEPKVRGDASSNPLPARTWAKPLKAVLFSGRSTASLSGAEATAGLDAPLSRVFRSTTELSQSGPRLVHIASHGGTDGLFFLERSKVLEVRRISDGDLVLRIPTRASSNLRPIYVDRQLIIPTRAWLEAYDVSRTRPRQVSRWRMPIQRSRNGPQLGRGTPIHALYPTRDAALVLTGGNDLLAVDARTGQVRWRKQLKAMATGGVHVEGSRALAVTTFPARLTCLRLDTGKVQWTYTPPRRPGLQARVGNPTWLGADRLVYVLGGKRLVAVDAKTGKELWISPARGADWVTEVHVSGDGSSVVARQQSGLQYGLRVYDARSGKELWRDLGNGAYRLGEAPPKGPRSTLNRIVLRQDTLYTLRRRNNRSELWAQELAFGRRNWFYKLPPGSKAVSVVQTPGAVIVARTGVFSSNATITVVGRGSGRVAETHALPGRLLTGLGAQAVAGHLVVTTERGVFAFGSKDERRLVRETIRLARALQKAPHDAVVRTRLASRFNQLGRRRAALELLRAGLLKEGVRTKAFDRMFARMAAISETVSEETPPQFSIRSLPRPPEIDGELNDWWRPWSAIDLSGPRYVHPIQQAPGSAPGRWTGKEDLSAKLYMGYDEKHFYFALDVSDMHLRPYDSESERWIGDCLLIAIDCRNDGGNVVLADDVLLSLALTLPKKKKDEDEEDQPQQPKKNRPDGKYFVHRKEDNSGAIYEVSIPWSLFAKNGARINPARGPKKGFTFGFNVVLTDDDGDRFDANDPNHPRGGPRGALKALELTPGVLLHHRKNRLWRGYIPKRFAKITLK